MEVGSVPLESRKETEMPRNVGDKNLTLREQRLKTETAALRAKLGAAKAATKVKDAKIAELRNKLRTTGGSK